MNPNYVFIRGQFFSVEYAKQHRNTCCELVKGVFLEKKIKYNTVYLPTFRKSNVGDFHMDISRIF